VILVDTSVWVEHLRRGDPRLVSLLEAGEVLCHPFVVGELACGNLQRRTEILGLLKQLPEAPVLDHGEALGLVESAGLAGAGLGWVDVHLLGAARVAGAGLWTLDRRLAGVAGRLGVAGT
jgi:predicted nucleic acid-binding protein